MNDDLETARLGEQIWQQSKWEVEMVTLARRRREIPSLETGARVSAPPKHGLRTEIPCGLDGGRQTGQCLNGLYDHRSHEVSATVGVDKESSTSPLSA